MSLPHKGMPPLETEGAALSFFEFWPAWIFYFPIYVYALWLMICYRSITLPTLANPSFPGGGLVGESKAEILDLLMKYIPEWTAPFTKHRKDPTLSIENQTTESLSAIQNQGFSIPLVAKPDIGCRGAGVRLIKTKEQLKSYIQDFPHNADFLLQKLIDFEGEAGVFYVRQPSEPKGRILSLTLKYFPYVYGDGASTLRDLILWEKRAGLVSHLYLKRHESRLDWVPSKGEPVRLAFAGSHSRGAIFRNGNHLITQAMEDRFDQISREIPEFYFGRFDVRFAEFTELQAGRGFTIVEANGAGAESTHIWDRNTSLRKAYADLFNQYRLLFQIGAENRSRGFQPLSFSEFQRMHQREKNLINLYPPNDWDFIFTKKETIHLCHSIAGLLGDRYKARSCVFKEDPLTLSHSEPEPDIAIFPPWDYSQAHPHSAFLVLEVANTSLKMDRRKASIYAKGKIPEYVLVNLLEEKLEIYKFPKEGIYTEIKILSKEELFTSEIVKNLSFSLNSFL